MARLDVNEGPEQLREELADVYNEWRRHIACRLGAAEEMFSSTTTSSNVRKWYYNLTYGQF